MAGMLNIGVTGLNAAQAQLNTTSHNITNAGTTGFHRQSVSQAAVEPLFTGAGFFGQGNSIVALQNSKLLAIGGDHAQFTCADHLVATHAVLRHVATESHIRRSYSASLLV